MKPKACKAKSRRLQDEVRDHVLHAFPDLEPGDVRSAPMGHRGADLILSPAAQRHFPFAVEAKCRETLHIWKALAQAASHVNGDARHGALPLLVFRRNRSRTYAVVELDVLLGLLQNAQLAASPPTRLGELMQEAFAQAYPTEPG